MANGCNTDMAKSPLAHMGADLVLVDGAGVSSSMVQLILEAYRDYKGGGTLLRLL